VATPHPNSFTAEIAEIAEKDESGEKRLPGVAPEPPSRDQMTGLDKLRAARRNRMFAEVQSENLWLM
jgi:hypothetical protein